jgi:outer membrane immunogenic protein
MTRVAGVGAVLLVVLAACPVHAQPYNWTGFYAGLNIGAGWSEQATRVSGDALTEAAIAAGALPRSLADDPAGVVGGGQVGYNLRLSWFVLGAEADARGADVSASETVSTAVTGFFPFTTKAEQELNFLGTLRGRVGVAPWGPLLVYGTGGFAFGHVSVSASVESGGCLGICASESRSGLEAGWTAGGGVEYGLATQWSVKAEYLHYDLGRSSISVRDARFPALVQRFRTDIEGHVVSLGVNYRF